MLILIIDFKVDIRINTRVCNIRFRLRLVFLSNANCLHLSIGCLSSKLDDIPLFNLVNITIPQFRFMKKILLLIIITIDETICSVAILIRF